MSLGGYTREVQWHIVFDGVLDLQEIWEISQDPDRNLDF